MSDILRITGISTGWDTDSLVESLMKVENLKVDKLEQKKQMVEWEQEAYRDVTNQLRTFTDDYFDVLKPETNFRSPSSFAKFDYSVSSSAVSVTANATITDYTHTINSITQLATKDLWAGNTSGLRGIKTDSFSIGDFQTAIANSGKDFEVTVAIGSESKTISIAAADIASMGSVDDLATRMSTEIENEFGSDYANMVTVDSGELKIDLAGNTVKLLEVDTNTESMAALGLSSGVSSRDYTTKTLNELFSLTDAQLSAVSINGVSDLGLLETDTVSEMISKINGSTAGVTLSFDELQDQFILEANSEGSVNNIDIEDGSMAEVLFQELFNVSELIDATGTADVSIRTEAQNAHLNLDGVDIIQSSNTFNVSGVTYTLNETSTTAIDIEVEQNTDGIIDNIVQFANDYNEMISSLHAKLDEVRDYDYDPLTDEQKDALSEDEVEDWEEKAKSGILRNASEIENMLLRMRQALYEPIDGVDISLNDIGIKSSSNYKDQGKLIIDEDKLRSSLANNYDQIVQLFTNQSDKEYLDSDNVAERYSENGIAHRFHDILQDNIRTTRDESGSKGLLLEKAGVVGDTSQYKNFLTESINDYDVRIDDLLELLADKEEAYYLKFARMETALAELQEQSSSVVSMLG